MTKLLHILLYVAVPLAWGVGVEVCFEMLRRWRARRAEEPCEDRR